jgi:hypothetical protein
MSNEVYAFALKNTLHEIQNICPDVSNTFIFKNGKITAKDDATPEENVNQTITAFESITERADTIGGMEAVTIQTAKGKVRISCMNDFYLTTVTSKGADEKYINTLTRVLIPTVIRLTEKILPASANDETLATADSEPVEEFAPEPIAEETEEIENNQPIEETPITEPEEEQPTPEIDTEPPLPEPPVTQLIVENLGGLLVPSDTVRIDNAVIAQWNELYDNRKIAEADLETLNGTTTRCKFKPIKDSKQEGKGIIQMPEKIQLTLQTSKGELVMVKPVVE